MEKDKSALYERIEKLLALSKSSNPHEAAAALSRAQKLMSLHDISYSELNTLSIGESDAVLVPGLKTRAVLGTIGAMVGKCFGVFAFTTSTGSAVSKLTFIGPKERLEGAVYACVFLQRQLKIAISEFKRKEKDKQGQRYLESYLKVVKDFYASRSDLSDAHDWLLPKTFAEIKKFDPEDEGQKIVNSKVAKAARNYTQGWLESVYSNLEEFAGVTKEEREAMDHYVSDKYPSVHDVAQRHNSSSFDYSAYTQGLQDGSQDGKLHQAIKGSQQSKLLEF